MGKLGSFHRSTSSQLSTDVIIEYRNRKLFLVMYSQRIEGPVLALPIFIVLNKFFAKFRRNVLSDLDCSDLGNGVGWVS